MCLNERSLNLQSAMTEPCKDACLALIVAAGRGTRMAAQGNKLLLPLAGKPVLVHTLAVFQASSLVSDICVICGPDEEEHLRASLVAEEALAKVVAFLPGGKERKDSVWNGLQWAREHGSWQWVCVHDGARPLVTEDLLARCLSSAKRHGSGVAAVRVTDTIKRADSEGWVEETLDRSRLWRIQTPQIFEFDLLYGCYERRVSSEEAFCDDAILLELEGHRVRLVAGLEENLKVTIPVDLTVAEAQIQKRRAGDCGSRMADRGLKNQKKAGAK